jgi:isopentenyldiphosphate isomerase
MSKEYFDVLDENGNKTGKIKLRSEVHRDGDWHKAVHIWIINENGDILLQRRCATKDSNPNMLDISSAGHLSAGDSSLDGAIRELKEELNLDVKPDELQFIKTLKRSSKYTETFINNEFDDLYILRTNKTIDEMNFQEEEISEIFYVSYKDFKKMVQNKQLDLLRHDEEFEILFNLFDVEFDN